MADQILDKKTAGIPSDIDLARHETELMRDDARASAASASASQSAAAESESAAAVHASDARQSAQEAAYWATLHNQGIHFGPDEPGIRWDGMTWLMTDEAARKIKSFRRWDSSLSGNALFPSDDLFPGDGLFPTDRGDWTDFSY